MENNRREFIKNAGKFTLGYGLASTLPSFAEFKANNYVAKDLFFKISLAQWSLHKAIRAGKMDTLDFPAKARKDFNIGAVEYVNQLFMDKAKDMAYLTELKKRCEDNAVKSLLIMIDHEGELGNTNEVERIKAVENHYKWADAAKFLGCHSIRVNAAGEGTAEEVHRAAVDGLSRLTEYGTKNGLNVIVENHGSYSSNGKWLASVIKEVNNPRCGILPDFGNFHISKTEEYDKYKGVKEFMPYAKGVSAKSFDFDANGNETSIDYKKMLKIVKHAGYTGYLGIEFEGNKLSEDDGIRATQKLLERVGAELS